MELHKESNQREQSRHSDWNPHRGSRNKIPGGWQSAGDYGADGDEHGGGVSGVVSVEEIDHYEPVIKCFSEFYSRTQEPQGLNPQFSKVR